MQITIKREIHHYDGATVFTVTAGAQTWTAGNLVAAQDVADRVKRAIEGTTILSVSIVREG